MRRPEEQLQRSVVDLLQVYANRGLLAFCHVRTAEGENRPRPAC